MNIKVIKRPIPEEICEDGGASVVIVGKDTIDLETSIDEAKDSLIVVGDKLLIKGMFVGLFKSMVKGIERDGNGRQLGDFITLYPVPTGEFDLDRGWQIGVNGVRIRARLMNELEIDISKWEFEDVTPGRQAFTLGSVECGERQLGVVDFVHPVWINGKPLPHTDEIRIDWAVEGTDRHGTVPAAKVTSTASRATVAADALSELASEENDGKTIVFTVRGNFASAKISAKLKYVAPQPEPIAKSEDGITKVMTLVDAVTGADRVISGMNDFVLDGEGLELAEDGGDGVTGVKFSGPGLEDYLDLTQGARNDGSKLIAGVGSYVDTLEPGDHECHLGLYLKHGEATNLNVWIDFTLRKE